MGRSTRCSSCGKRLVLTAAYNGRTETSLHSMRQSDEIRPLDKRSTILAAIPFPLAPADGDPFLGGGATTSDANVTRELGNSRPAAVVTLGPPPPNPGSGLSETIKMDEKLLKQQADRRREICDNADNFN